MTTASDIKMRVALANVCENLDTWIDDVLCPKFLASGGASITMPLSLVSNNGWRERVFLSEMRNRGFVVRTECPDSQAELFHGYYRIALDSKMI